MTKRPTSSIERTLARRTCAALIEGAAGRTDLVRKVREVESDDATEDRPVRHDTVVAVAPQQPGAQTTAPATQASAPAKSQPAVLCPPPTRMRVKLASKLSLAPTVRTAPSPCPLTVPGPIPLRLMTIRR
mgnify:CR=1 FL=1